MAHNVSIANPAAGIAAVSLPNGHPGGINLVFSNNSYKRMFAGFTYSDHVTGIRKPAWATWILSEGTVPGGLLERCLVWDGPGHGSKQLKLSKPGLDINTVPDGLLEVDTNTGEITIALKTKGRDDWVAHYGLPKHRRHLTYGGTTTVYKYDGGRWML